MRGVYALVFLIVLLGCSGMVWGAELKGAAFEWYSLEPLSNVIIDVNSVPMQRVISTGSGYSFELQPGHYTLRAEYYENAELLYETDEVVYITGDGVFNLDLIMLPVLSDPDEFDEEFDVNADVFGGLGDDAEADFTLILLGIIAIVIVIGVVLIFFRRKKAGAGSEPVLASDGEAGVQETETGAVQESAEPAESEETLDMYAQEVLDVLQRSGNRLTQKELRDRVSGIGEAKISLILTELEAAGKIKKIKKGRGNIIIFKE